MRRDCLKPMARNSTVRLGLLLFPQFSLMAFSAALEPLRSANRLLGRDFYRWTIISPAWVYGMNWPPTAAGADRR